MSNIWQSLTIHNIITIVEETLQRKLTNLCLQRNSYINRVFELECADNKERIIVKFYRPGRWSKEMILEEHTFIQELFEQEIPVIQPLKINIETLFNYQNINFALYPKKGGRALDEFAKETWQQIGRMLGRLHLIGKTHQNSSRLVWRPSLATKQHLTTLIQGKYLLPEYEKALLQTAEALIHKTDKYFKKENFILLHGDCHKGNLIHRPGEGIFLVDFDDICQGPAIQDLWMLLPDHLEHAQQEFNWFLTGYETFSKFPQESTIIIPALRAMRIIHFAAWCALQSNDLDFRNHFPEWGATKYWNEIIKELQGILRDHY